MCEGYVSKLQEKDVLVVIVLYTMYRRDRIAMDVLNNYVAVINRIG